MIKNISILFSLFICLTNKAQDTISFQDDYSDNRNNWEISTSETQFTKLEDGKLIFGNPVTGSKWTYKNIFIDPTKDFSIESNITQLTAETNHGFGLVVGLDGNSANYIVFNLSGNSFFTIYEYKNKVYSELKAWTELKSIKPLNSSNKLMIKKSGNRLKFFINDVEIYSTEYKQFVGTYYGFFIGEKMSIAVDNLIIKQNIPSKINLIKNITTGLKKENLGENINSEFAEKMPVISPDGKTLFIVRGHHPKNVGGDGDDIWVSEALNDTAWGTVKNIGFPLNNLGPNYVISITPDNNTLLLGNTYNDDGSSKSSGFSLSHKTNNGWSIPKEVKMKNYHNLGDYSSSFLANNGKVILMDAQLSQTYGDNDIYVSFLENDGEWSEPKNLGPVINTFGSEYTPFMAADGVTLYFSTNGKRGYGSNDIFMSKRLDSTWVNWSEPENLGPEINTDSWDAYYTFPASAKYAYVASTKNSLGKLDIFKIKLPQAFKPNPVILISGRVFNAKTKEPIGATIKYENLADGKNAGIASSNPTTGEYKIVLPYGKKYGFMGYAEKFVSVSTNIDLTHIEDYKEINRDLYLVPMEIGSTVRLNNLFFDSGKDSLRSESYPEIDRLMGYLIENKTMEIEISGHTDNVGGTASNLSLSDKRAKAVTAYLISKGLKSERIKAKGYGESKPLSENNTEEGRQLNRRVEFTILKN